MKKIHLLYSKSHLPLSRLICWRTGSPVSHSAILFTDGNLDDKALVFESTISGKGTHFTTLGDFKKRASAWWLTELVETVNQQQYDRMVETARKMNNKPYDMLGVLGLGIGAGRDWQENDKWWCSEAVANIVSASGLALMDWANIHTVTPKDNWLWPQTILQTSKVQ